MDKDVEAIRRVLLGAIEEKQREKHKEKVAGNVALIGSSNVQAPTYISSEQRASVMQLLMEFYRILHRDEPETKFSDVNHKFMHKFKIKSLEFITRERFDEIVLDLLNAINNYGESEPQIRFDNEPDDFVGFEVQERPLSRTQLIASRTQRNVTNYLLRTSL